MTFKSFAPQSQNLANVCTHLHGNCFSFVVVIRYRKQKSFVDVASWGIFFHSRFETFRTGKCWTRDTYLWIRSVNCSGKVQTITNKIFTKIVIYDFTVKSKQLLQEKNFWRRSIDCINGLKVAMRFQLAKFCKYLFINKRSRKNISYCILFPHWNQFSVLTTQYKDVVFIELQGKDKANVFMSNKGITAFYVT